MRGRKGGGDRLAKFGYLASVERPMSSEHGVKSRSEFRRQEDGRAARGTRHDRRIAVVIIMNNHDIREKKKKSRVGFKKHGFLMLFRVSDCFLSVKSFWGKSLVVNQIL